MTAGDPGDGPERLDEATRLLRATPAPDSTRAVDRALAQARRWRRDRPLSSDVGDLVGDGHGEVRVAEHLVVGAVRRAGDRVPRLLVTRVRVLRDGERCTGLEVECSAEYGTDLAVAGAAVARSAAAALTELLGPSAPSWREVAVTVVDVLVPRALPEKS